MNKKYEVWIKPYLGIAEVGSKHSSKLAADQAMAIRLKSNPSWKIWITTQKQRHDLANMFDVADDDSGYFE